MTAFPFPYVIVVTDGSALRTLHPAGLGAHRAAIEAAIGAVLDERPTHIPGFPAPKPTSKPAPPAAVDTMTQGEIARASGYTGDVCQTCGEFRMKRSGTCLTCEACGSTSGGCS